MPAIIPVKCDVGFVSLCFFVGMLVYLTFDLFNFLRDMKIMTHRPL